MKQSGGIVNGRRRTKLIARHWAVGGGRQTRPPPIRTRPVPAVDVGRLTPIAGQYAVPTRTDRPRAEERTVPALLSADSPASRPCSARPRPIDRIGPSRSYNQPDRRERDVTCACRRPQYRPLSTRSSSVSRNRSCRLLQQYPQFRASLRASPSTVSLVRDTAKRPLPQGDNSRAFCMLRCAALIAAAAVLLVGDAVWAQPIPGCADIDNLEASFNVDNTNVQDLLLCFCQSGADRLVSINCLYGSTLDDLVKAVGLAKAVNRTVDRILLNHVDFNETGLDAGLFQRIGAPLVEITIGLCAQNAALKVHPEAFKGLESTLRNLSLYECQIDQVPAAVRTLPNLERLSLYKNKISELSKKDLTGLDKLKMLNIGGNFLVDVEAGALSQFKMLDTLILGDHNYMNESFFKEFSHMPALEILDLSKADGLTDFPPGTLSNLTKLKQLLVSGCSLVNITTDMFAGLNDLEKLDLRVNLIERIEPKSFASLKKLKRLSLAGNYLTSISADDFTGLDSMEDLDIGWNELKGIPTGAFQPVSKTLTSLDLRHNTALTELAPGAFAGLEKVKNLNLSETGLASIDPQQLQPLKNLEYIDLTATNLTALANDSFVNNPSLRILSIGATKLTALPVKMLESLPKLERIDLSQNAWICDDKFGTVIDYVLKQYRISAEAGRAFFMENANDTTCDRPYSLKDEVVTGLDPKLLQPYDAAADTTTPPTTTTEEPAPEPSPKSNATSPSATKVPFISLEGEPSAEPKPRVTIPPYDINKVASGGPAASEGETDKVTLTVAIIVVVLASLTILIIVAVVCYVKKQKHTDVVTDTELSTTYKTAKNGVMNGDQIRDGKIDQVQSR